MPFTRGFTVTVTRYTRNTDGDWLVGASFTIDNCAVSPSSKRTYETETYAEDAIRADLVLFVPSGSGVQATDHVTLPDGTEWEVWGYPVDYASPFTGWAPGGQVNLRRFTG